MNQWCSLLARGVRKGQLVFSLLTRRAHSFMSSSPETVLDSYFEALLGSDFTVRFQDGQSASLRLNDLKKLGHKLTEANRDPFSLVFLGQPGWRIPQGTYAFEHGDGLKLDIFITQIGDGAQGSLFEAVFT